MLHGKDGPLAARLAEGRSSVKAQRVRLRFARGLEAASIGHLDMARIWDGALRDAGIAVSYSEGAKPKPRLTIAAGLPMGVTSGGEILDVILAQCLVPKDVARRVGPQLPLGLAVCEAWEVGMGLPSLPSAVRWADYEADVPITKSGPPTPAAAAAAFLAKDSVPWDDTRGEKVRHYDLRRLVQTIGVVAVDGQDIARITMRLRCDASGVGRPDQVVKALGLNQPSRIHRRCLVLADVSPARDAWRRKGRFLA